MIRRCLVLIPVLCGSVSLGTARAADDAAVAPAAQQSPAPFPRTPDFLIGAPRARLSVRGSWVMPRAGGELFTFVGDQLTFEPSDLRSRGIAADLAIALGPRVDLVTGVERSRRSTGSEYRQFVASNGQPITQTTRLQQTGVTLGLRYLPLGSGRRISRLAFIPRRITPYVGAGAMASLYNFSQRGQFVDFADRSIFTDAFVSDGWTFGPFVHGGAELQVWKRLSVSVDGRYNWLHGALDSDFSGFDGIDLAGFRASTGFGIAF
jgi:hypothetical protein